MVYNDIRNYLGRQNFAVASTAQGALDVLCNQVDGQPIFCVLLNSTSGNFFNENQIKNTQLQLEQITPAQNILFILVTSFVERDKELAKIEGVNLWLVDEFEQQLYIYETQPEDFFGLKRGVVQAICETPSAKTTKALRKKNLPWVTIVLIAINVIVFFILAFKGDTGSAQYMYSMGAAYGPAIFEHHEYWRLITCMFMHFSLMHLGSNMIYLGIVGFTIENSIGHLKFALLYMLSGFAASIISAAVYYFAGDYTVAAGASGAIYGLIGVVVYLTFKNRGRMSRGNMWFRVTTVLLFIFVSNFLDKSVDAVAHIAGFVFGVILAILFLGGKKNEKS